MRPTGLLSSNWGMSNGHKIVENKPTLLPIANRYPINEHKISSFFVHYTLDFVAVSIHVTIYAASSAFHMATALYVSALVKDTLPIFKRCESMVTRKDMQPCVREANIKKALNEVISLHVNILK